MMENEHLETVTQNLETVVRKEQNPETVTLKWGETPPWMEKVGTRGSVIRNGIAFTRFGLWIGEEPVFVLKFEK
jgi:putative SOS response-associated peptidase YedK